MRSSQGRGGAVGGTPPVPTFTVGLTHLRRAESGRGLGTSIPHECRDFGGEIGAMMGTEPADGVRTRGKAHVADQWNVRCTAPGG